MKKIGMEIENAIKDNELLDDEYDALLTSIRKTDKKRKDEIKKNLEQARRDSKISDKELEDGYAGRKKSEKEFTGRKKAKISNPNLKKMHLSESLFTESEDDFEDDDLVMDIDDEDDMPLEIEDDEIAETPLDENEFRVGDTIRIIHAEGEPQLDGKVGTIDHIDDAGQLHGTWGGIAVSPEYGDELELVKDDISDEEESDFDEFE